MNHKRSKKYHDLIYFIKKNKWRIFFGIFFQIFMANSVLQEMVLEHKTTYQAAWFYSLKGQLEFKALQTNKFMIPILWFVFEAYILYLVCDYFKENCSGIGTQRLLRMNSRRKWFTKLTVSCVYMITFYYICYALILKGTMLFFHLSNTSFIEGNQPFIKTVIATYVLPVLATVTIFLIQNTVSMITNEFIALLVSVAILILSSYWKNIFLIGNYTMLLRSLIYNQHGISPYIGISVCMIVSILALFLGLWKVQHVNLIGKELLEK